MKALVGIVAVSVVSAILLFSALPGLAIEHKYIEDFKTTQYKDAVNTKAWWDTVAGKLKLYPFVPTLVGTCATPSAALGVSISGDHAFVADYGSGLQVIDISDPATPTLVGAYDTPGIAWRVTVAGDYAFVADGAPGLQVIDISDPTTPTLVGIYNTPGNALGVTVSGDHAFIADGASGLQVIDISDPATPALVGTYNTPGEARDVTVSGDLAFIADGASGLQVIDISDPTSPTLVRACDTPGFAQGVTVSGDHALVADEYMGLQVIDMSDPVHPEIVGTCDTPGNALGVTVSGAHAFVTDYGSGLQVIDISDPANPKLAGSYDTPSYAISVAVSGDHAFVADYGSGLQVIEISEPAAPALVGNCVMPGGAWAVAVSGDHAFVADAASGLQVIDIGDPPHSTIVGTCDTPGIARGVTVSGDHVYVADSNDWLQVIDISDPTHPTIVGTCATPDPAYDVAISGDYAFMAAAYSGLLVIDISDPTHPTIVGTCNTPGIAGAIAVSGDHVLVADYGSGLQVIDISDPTTPTLAGACDTPGEAWGITVSGDHAFVADGFFGLQVIDISNPAAPTLVGTYNTPGEARDVTVSGEYVFVADNNFGLQVIDISDPTTPMFAGTYDTYSAQGVAISGEHVFLADYVYGLQVIQVFQSEFDSNNNIGRSLAVDASSDGISRARLLTTQTNTVTWQLSANGGVNWQAIASDGSWNRFAVPGSNILWRSAHAWAAPGVNPAVTKLEIDWLVDAALIDSIIDAPDDQGGWVRAHFTRSARDFEDEATLPISSYGIWRRVDSAALAAALETQASAAVEKSAADDVPDLGGLPVLKYQGRMYVQSRPGFAASSFPPGTWMWVATVPAVQQDAYIATVPTAADSSLSGTNHTVLVVTAHTTTPSVWYVSEPDSGYSLDNIAPAVPTSFAVAYNTGSGNHLSWNPSPDEDFQYFNVYRSSNPDFIPSPSELVHSLIGTDWSDPEYDGWSVYYKITALDYVGNESDPASAGTVTAVEEPAIPQTYRLYPNVPNPFNPSTSIRYDVPAGGGAVTLRIYDVSGRLVRTLVEGPQAAGLKTVTWNGEDDRGRGVVSGVYFYRLEAPGYKKTLKMILIQ